MHSRSDRFVGAPSELAGKTICLSEGDGAAGDGTEWGVINK